LGNLTATEFIDQLLIEVEFLLKEKWKYVQTISAALLEKTELNQEELLEILNM